MLSVLLAVAELLMLLTGAILFSMREWRWRGRFVGGQRARALSILLWLPAPARLFLADVLLPRAPSRELATSAIRQLELALILSVCLLAIGLFLSAPADEEENTQGSGVD